jgi:carboxymethylenebutenolidase
VHTIIMFADITKPPAPLPTSQLTTLSKGMFLLPPLSRRGHGPGLIILHRHLEDPLAFYDGAPLPLLKWAEEGYAVVQLDPTSFDGRPAEDVLREAVEALNQCSQCDPKGNVGLVCK